MCLSRVVRCDAVMRLNCANINGIGIFMRIYEWALTQVFVIVEPAIYRATVFDDA